MSTIWQDLREVVLRTAAVFSKKRRERELSEELEFHLALKEARYREAGAAPVDASRRSKRDFGGLERWKERCRDSATVRPFEDLQRDLHLALRVLWKAPVFTSIAVVTLAAAISANTTVFSLMNAILLKAVAVPHPDRLALLRIQPGEFGYAFNYPWYKNIERRSAGIMRVFAFTGRNLRLKTAEGIEDVPCQLVSGSYFPILAVAPALGRYLTPQDDRPGTPSGQPAVISGAFWRARFGSDTSVIGRKLILNQTVFTIAGVMPDSFRGMERDQRPDVFLPLESEPLIDAPFNSIAAGYKFWWLKLGSRLDDGVSLGQAAAFLKTNSRTLTESKDIPTNFSFNGYKLQQLYIDAEPGLGGYSYIRLRFAKPLEVLMGLVGLVLLVACLNLATLLIARGSARHREISTRFALGASRFRLVRQLLSECLLLSLAGAAAGLPIALLLTRVLALFLAPQHSAGSAQIDTQPDPMVFAFTAMVVMLATLVTGVTPALRSTAPGLQSGLREASATLRAVERRRFWPRTLLAIEVAAALVLVSGASLLGYSFLKLHSVPLGFDPAGLIHLTVETGTQRVPGAALAEAYRQLTEGLKRLPTVSDVSICQIVPFTGTVGMTVAGPGAKRQPLWQNDVGPDYFRTMHTPVREGREFRWSDTEKAPRVAILNTAAAKILFPQGHALGEVVTSDGVKVVGIVDDVKYSSVRNAAPPTVYYPATYAMADSVPSLVLLLRTSGPAAPLVAAAAKVIHRSWPEIPAPVAITMEDTLNESLASERMLTLLATFFGVLALVITAIGLYGTLAYMTERRTGEIGIRLALGARPAQIASLVFRENGAIAALGCLAGLLLSFTASKLMAGLLFGITARDPLAFAAAVIALFFVAVAASLWPAAKAARIDPVAAIRHE